MKTARENMYRNRNQDVNRDGNNSNESGAYLASVHVNDVEPENTNDEGTINE